jgi:hypothetical protein
MTEPPKEGHVIYSGDIRGLELDEPLEIHPISASIPRIIITEDDSKLSINITLANVYTEEAARLIAQDNMRLIVNRLIFEFDCSIENLQLRGLSLPQRGNGSLQITVVDHIKVYAYGTVGPLKPGMDRLQEVADKLKQPETDADFLIDQYRIAVSQRDEVTRFLFLYHILLFINQDKQRAVDQMIVGIEPTIIQSPSPRYPDQYETIFTRLRNELGHHRPNTSVEVTKGEIRENVGLLQSITKKAILMSSQM